MKQILRGRRNPMVPHSRHVAARLLACTLCLLIFGLAAPAGDSAAAAVQRTFSSPEAAADALFVAVKANDTRGMVALFGPGTEALASSGDEVEDRQCRERFLTDWEEAHRLEQGADGRVTLYVGAEDWPLPLPIVGQGGRWRFDARAGAREILSRRIGNNELSAIQVCLAIADAQFDYADWMRERQGLPEYAQKFESTRGLKDGLYWEMEPGGDPSPLGPLIARARDEGYAAGVLPEPYHGYLYRIMKVQGIHAGGGAYPYVIDGRMIGGFAVLAYPAVYGVSGVSAFMTNHDGAVYRKDLGKDTALIAWGMMMFDPDGTWVKVK